MSNERSDGWLVAHPELAISVFSLASTISETTEFVQAALKQCLTIPSWKGVALLKAESGKWITLGSVGTAAKPSSDLLADVLDRGAAVQVGSTIVAPLASQQSSSELLVVT